jgi:hypothetical protein
VSGGRHQDDHAGHGHNHGHDLRYISAGAQPEVAAAEADLLFPGPAGQAELKATLSAFLSRLTADLAAAGCLLVGHIKGVVVAGDEEAAGDGDELAFSLTHLDGTPRFTGGLRGDGRAFRLTLNVIVFGVDVDALPGIVTGAWPEAVPAFWRPYRNAPGRRGTPWPPRTATS